MVSSTPNHQEAPVATTPQILNPLESAKAYIALVGSVATALLAVFTADSPVGNVLVVVSVVATTLGTFAVPNKTAEPDAEFGDEVYLDGHAPD